MILSKYHLYTTSVQLNVCDRIKVMPLRHVRYRGTIYVVERRCGSIPYVVPRLTLKPEATAEGFNVKRCTTYYIPRETIYSSLFRRGYYQDEHSTMNLSCFTFEYNLSIY